ncbi:MAG: citrate/2-methylcitrate synthase [Candidatus Latescibacteria bacterium]|nr:citrate synthase [Gemmatimonadaceae bacterium]MDP7447436.1 citrate/2-methylcitrate synthase [Candidatus Latescibacterota bacterium]HJP33928.1 citrate/2-methylcitrate synthase [Candidatus Latescibacterota bacterium]|tara:strand:- start:481 stop:1602 length:1122 start_codon:yes stop_codon:yes gene_type:complete
MAEYSPGLAGVVAGESAISRIDFDSNRLIVRGYNLEDLTDTASFEEVAWLVLYGDLPTQTQLAELDATLKAERELPPQVLTLLREAPSTTHPMALMRTAVSALGTVDPEAGDISREASLRKAVRLLAKAPAILAAGHRYSQGQEPVLPDADLSHAANLLYMISGDRPSASATAAMNVSLILYMEHGYNASTFAARVVASTLADLHAAVTAGIAALVGPLHGGANEAAMQMFIDIGSPERAREYVLDMLARKQKIMGFGHREYKTGDSRVPAMKAVGRRLAEEAGETRWADIADAVEQVLVAEKGIFPNLDTPCAYTYYTLGIPISLFTPIFVASRITGWAAHIVEQQQNNRLIRPGHIYTGPEGRAFRPLAER